jgi:quinol monooxygenase YgiN
MHLRFVQVRIKSTDIQRLRTVYEQKIIPTMETIEGCLYVGLFHNTLHPDECISLSFWSNRDKIDAYEKSGVFGELLNASKPYFDESSEWQMKLSDDLTLTYTQVPQEAVVKDFTIASPDQNPIVYDKTLFVRIVSHQVHSGMKEDFKRIYNNEVLPSLTNVSGCHSAYLTENPGNDGKLFSISIWATQADVDQYEQSGMFDTLLNKLKPALSGVYQWKMRLEHETGAQVVTTDDITVEGYSMITGKSFQSKGTI